MEEVRLFSMTFCAPETNWQNDIDDVRHIELSSALPCGIGRCGRPTKRALIEDDLARPALWTLLPICDDCARMIANQHMKRQTEKDAAPL